MEKKYQVFVSSTYQDLVEERDEVMKALLELDCIPSGMELFPSADEEAFSYIKKVIDNCDYFILIIAGRYGSEHPSGKSYTHLEYEYAQSREIPTLAFLHQNPQNLPTFKYELDVAKLEKLNQFKSQIQNKLCRYWTTKGELSALVSRSLVKLIKDKPRNGWTRQLNNDQLDIQSLILNKLHELEKRNETILKSHRSKEPVVQKLESLEYEKIELEITALSHSVTQQNNYAVILSASNLNGRVPIVIGGFEAQALAVAIEKVETSRPLTHHLIYNIIKETQYEVKEAVIYDVRDGIFYSKVVLTDHFNLLEMDSRTSDALTIAILANAPIYMSNLVFEQSMVEVKDDNQNND